MPRANRYFVPGQVCHVTHRCHNRQFLLKFAKHRNAYRDKLREGVAQVGLPLLDYCITSNHVHLLTFGEDEDQVSRFMHKVQGEFAQAYNRRKERSGAFWEDRFHSTSVEPGRHLEACMIYIGLNMVRNRKVTHPTDWPWCGYHELMDLRQRYRLIDFDRMLELLGGVTPEQFRRHYSSLILDKIAREEFRRDPRWTESIAVGTEAYVRKIEARIKGRQQLLTESAGDAWVLKEASAPYNPFSCPKNEPKI